MSKKLLYSAPEAELLVIKFEENFCQTTGVPGGAGGSDTIIDDDDMN